MEQNNNILTRWEEIREIVSEIDLSNYPVKIVECKFVLYKFEKPMNKNMHSIKILLDTPPPTNYSFCVSLYADSLKLTTTRKIKHAVEEELIHINIIPSELTPDVQYQLIAHIENFNAMVDVSPTTDKPATIKLKIKYSNYETPENIKELKINFYDDERVLKLTNGCLHISRRYY